MTNEKELTHIDLFSGIGGFTLAADWAGFRTVAFCEKEKFCQKVLQKRFGAIIADSKSTGRPAWPSKGQPRRCDSIPLIPEIRDFDGTKWREATLLTRGFPCQPFSVAGQRRGKDDDRYLWPEMFKIISEAKPCWILAENVPGIFRMALDTVLSDLEGEGYSTGTFIIPACGLNAPHRRNRVWIIANSRSGVLKMLPTPRAGCPGSRPNKKKGENSGGRDIEIVADTKASFIRGIRYESKKKRSQDSDELLGGSDRLSWEENWYEVATCFCRVDDGVSDRIHRLKALGNAIVPQIAYEILKNIAWIEKNL